MDGLRIIGANNQLGQGKLAWVQVFQLAGHRANPGAPGGPITAGPPCDYCDYAQSVCGGIV